MTTTSEHVTGADAFDVQKVRSDFPLLATKAHGKPIIYLDNGATTQKPRCVIDAASGYYEKLNANIHRGVYQLSELATAAYEHTRAKVAKFINAAEPAECIFVRGTTEGINLIANTYGRQHLTSGDEVLISELEHHSNIVPWQMICAATGATLKVVPINEAGEIDFDAYERFLKTGRVKIVAINHVSNSLGTVNPIEKMIMLAHRAGAVFVVDGAQWVAHGPTDVRALDADFYVFSGHKMMGPTGVGVMYGKRALLDKMPPWQGGGDMIASVTFARTEYAEIPNKFEAGTPNIEGVVALAAAIDYLTAIDLRKSAAYEADLLAYATKRVSEVPGLKIIGTAKQKAGVISFVMTDPVVSSLDVGRKLDRDGVCVRTGHHCCQPVMDHFKIGSTARISIAFYNTRHDIDVAVESLKKVAASAVTRARTEVHDARNAAAATAGSDALAILENLRFAPASAASVRKAADEMIETFDFLGDWENRDQFILDLGSKLLPLPTVLKTEATRVHGCQSIVHLVARKKPQTEDVLEFLADSDAHIVRGLIGVLQKLYSGQKARDILAFDITGFIEKLGLDKHLSMTRRNGLAGMIQKIREQAALIAGVKP